MAIHGDKKLAEKLQQRKRVLIQRPTSCRKVE